MSEQPVRSFGDVSDWLTSHARLVSLPGFATLSHFHLLIDDADVKFWNCVHEERDAGRLFKTLELTSFGREVGGDSPRWWVFAKERDLPTLWNDTKVTFLAAQTLLRNAEKLARSAFGTYGDLVDGIGRFLDGHLHELRALKRFAERLSVRHELAPAILFSYSVWGSTRRADRSLNGNGRGSVDARLQMAGELALGLRRRTWPTLYYAWLHALDDAYASASDEEYLTTSADELFQRVEYDIKHAFVEYFTEVRDSLRHIDQLCQEARQREHIYADDRFLSKLLSKIASEPATVESDLWDLKKTLDMWECPPQKRDLTCAAFAEDVAAFANSRGGVLIIGVDNATHTVVGVTDTENRMKHIESVLRSRIDSSADFIRVRAVPTAGATCVVIIVGQTAEPVAVRKADNSYTYPVRLGPGIERVSRSDVHARKPHMKGTSFAFAAELASWIGM